MKKLLERVCGLDVHRDTVKACARIPKEGKPDEREELIKTFGTTTPDLLLLRDWMKALGVTDAAMESTGVYWKPIYHILEDDFRVILVNAAHIKNVPGRKTDVIDCAWIAHLLECGLLSASFIPPKPIRDLRDLTRYRKELTQERTREVQRLHGVLQNAGIKLSSVASDIMGVSGQRMIKALMEGTTDPEVLADLAKGRLRAKLPGLRKALTGRFRDHHAFLTSEILAHIDYIEETLERLSKRIEEAIRPFSAQKEVLKTIPGWNDKTAEATISEIGVDMSKFPADGNLSSWAGLCPGNNESAGKHKSGKRRKGNKWLCAALTESANAVIRDKDSYYAALYARVVRRRGHKRAVIAVAHSMLVAAYHMLRTNKPYHELGGDYFDNLNREAIERICVKRLERLGYRVTLQSVA